MSQFTAKFLSNLDLLLSAKTKQLRDTHPTLADAFQARTQHDIRKIVSHTLDKLDHIRGSGRFSPQGERAEVRQLTHTAIHDQLATLRKATVDQLEADRAKREAALLAPKPTTKDPALALVHELRAQEVRRELRSLKPFDIQVRLKQAATTEAGAVLVDIIESDPIAAAGGTPIVGADVLKETRAQLAIAADPKVGELATLRDAYSFVLGSAEQTLIEASGLPKHEIDADPTPPGRAPQPATILSTGQPVKV